MKEIVPMIAIAKPAPKTKRCSNWHIGFLAMMPAIVKYVRHAFRHLDAESRADVVQEIVVSAMLAYYRLFQRGKVNLAYPSVLARFAIAQYRDGRRVGEKMNCRDVLSPYARRMKGVQVESLQGYDHEGEPWREVLVEDKHAGPAETAAARIDVAEWFDSMSARDRKIAEALSQGATTNDVAMRFCVSPGRISQKRREFLQSWRSFQGEQEVLFDDDLLIRLS
jgi:DNA-directed RNA polymerase specialized sigma24 family protein